MQIISYINKCNAEILTNSANNCNVLSQKFYFHIHGSEILVSHWHVNIKLLQKLPSNDYLSIWHPQIILYIHFRVKSTYNKSDIRKMQEVDEFNPTWKAQLSCRTTGYQTCLGSCSVRPVCKYDSKGKCLTLPMSSWVDIIQESASWKWCLENSLYYQWKINYSQSSLAVGPFFAMPSPWYTSTECLYTDKTFITIYVCCHTTQRDNLLNMPFYLMMLNS
jgi:hypothetical protein